MNRSQLRTDIEMAINRNSAENGSDTPDFILAEYLMTCLEAFDKTVHARSDWYSHHCRIGSCDHSPTKCVEPPVESKVEVKADTITKEPICKSCVKRSTCYFAQGGYICDGYQKEDPTKCPTCQIGYEYGCKEDDPCPSNGYNNWQPLNTPKQKIVNDNKTPYEIAYDCLKEIAGGLTDDWGRWGDLAKIKSRKALADIEKIKQPTATLKEPESIGKAISEAILDEETRKLGLSMKCSTCCEYLKRQDVECDSNFNWRNCSGPYKNEDSIPDEIRVNKEDWRCEKCGNDTNTWFYSHCMKCSSPKPPSTQISKIVKYPVIDDGHELWFEIRPSIKVSILEATKLSNFVGFRFRDGSTKYTSPWSRNGKALDNESLLEHCDYVLVMEN